MITGHGCCMEEICLHVHLYIIACTKSQTDHSLMAFLHRTPYCLATIDSNNNKFYNYCYSI